MNQQEESKRPSEIFGTSVFNRSVMQRMLPKNVYKHLIEVIDNRIKIKEEFADIIALALKEWALEKGATHYTHWFQPLTGASAEKHDSFIDWCGPEQVLEKFSGRQLIQGEPDASSFPSGGLRSTYEARGYTGWDPSSPPFLWKGGDGVTLCIPSVFFSWTGNVLDTKIPLLRSDAKVNDAVLRLLKLTGVDASSVFSTIGLEQEYFIIDRELFNLRPDLLLLGKTVVGAAAPKGQELQDHYFGAVKDPILSFMQEFETRALKLGIPVKTRHNEVAPAQHEVAPLFERASIAVDHNILLMQLMRQTAANCGLSCLLHEKPFYGLNGSGKHCNWSLSTDSGLNLLNPTDAPENNIHFLILLVAVLHGVWKHSALLRASIGSASNDDRLGGHEAPPAIISIYLGDPLEQLLNDIETKGSHVSSKKGITYDFGLAKIPDLSKDQTDRNRTSPFAFTGNKFEFRAVGSSSNPAFPVTVLNAAVAESLNEILDEIEEGMPAGKKIAQKDLPREVIPVLKKFIKKSKPIRFQGDNYSEEWAAEAKKRGLPNIPNSIDAFPYLDKPESVQLFNGILTKAELTSRKEILLEIYSATIDIEAKLITELFKTMIYPAALKTQKLQAQALTSYQTATSDKPPKKQVEKLRLLAERIESAAVEVDLLEKLRLEAVEEPLLERSKKSAHSLRTQCKKARKTIDALETICDDQIWPLPKLRKLLYTYK